MTWREGAKCRAAGKADACSTCGPQTPTAPELLWTTLHSLHGRNPDPKTKPPRKGVINKQGSCILWLIASRSCCSEMVFAACYIREALGRGGGGRVVNCAVYMHQRKYLSKLPVRSKVFLNAGCMTLCGLQERCVWEGTPATVLEFCLSGTLAHVKQW